VGAGPDVLAGVVLHVPDRRVGGGGQVAEGDVAEPLAVDALDPLTVEDPGEAARAAREQGEESGPVHVGEVTRAERQGEVRNLAGAPPRGEGEAEQGCARAECVRARPDPALLEGAGHPHQRGEDPASPAGDHRDATAQEVLDRPHPERREGVALSRAAMLPGQGRHGAAHRVEERHVAADARNERPRHRDRVEVLPDPQQVERGVEQSSFLRIVDSGSLHHHHSAGARSCPGANVTNLAQLRVTKRASSPAGSEKPSGAPTATSLQEGPLVPSVAGPLSLLRMARGPVGVDTDRGPSEGERSPTEGYAA
jgi:hypothetical protein